MDYVIFENNKTYNPTTFDTYIENFKINFNYSSDYNLLTSSNLNYNGTNYSSTIIFNSFGNAILYSNVSIPITANPYNATFYWNIGLSNSTGTYFFNSNKTNQTVNILNPAYVNYSCGSDFPAMIFNFYDEDNFNQLSNVSISYNIKYGINNYTSNSVNGSLVNGSLVNNNLTICINKSISNYKIGYGEIQYQTPSFSARRYYIFNGHILSNSTTEYISLYNLNTSRSTSFLMDMKDKNLNSYIGDYIASLRWYPDLNQYIIVEMAKTDDNGQSLMKFKTEDIDYRIALYDTYGNLINMDNPVRMVCLVTPCSYNMRVVNAQSYNLYEYGIQSNLSYDNSLKTFTYIWNDPSQIVKNMTLLVVSETGYGTNNTICNITGNGYIGILKCNASGYTGLIDAVVYKSASPSTIIAHLYEEIRSTLNNDFGLFAGFTISIIAFLVGIWSPIASIIIGVVGLVIPLVLGSINMTIFIAIAVLGGIVIHLIKSTNQPA